MELTQLQWIVGGIAALLIGFSKTGVPGAGILVVPLMAFVFGARQSVGTMVVLLIVADCFAVAQYRRYARWDKLWGLVPWVLFGMGMGAIFLRILGNRKQGAIDLLNPIIGVLILVLIVITLARQRWGDRLNPSSRFGIAATGGMAGFTTTISNAAGPIMGLYMTSLDLPKQQFMGTGACYFFMFNLLKIPLYVMLDHYTPGNPLMTQSGLIFDVCVIPLVVIGALMGRWLLPHIPQVLFERLVIILAAVAALNLIFPHLLFR